MGILSDFFIASGDAALSYDESFPAQDVCHAKSITPLEAAGMLAVLRGGADRLGLIGEFDCLTAQEADNWTMSVPDDMVTALASIDEGNVSRIATQFADATQEELGWGAADFEPIVTQLAALARKAGATNKKMFLWNSL
jgi:hypothetical protein